ERDAPLAHPHRLDEAVAGRLHPANIQGPARGRKSCLMPSHFTFCYRLKPRHTGRERSDRDTATYGFALRSCATPPRDDLLLDDSRLSLHPDSQKNDHRGSNPWGRGRSEEHTSELQSRGHLVCRLLLEKKKNIIA